MRHCRTHDQPSLDQRPHAKSGACAWDGRDIYGRRVPRERAAEGCSIDARMPQEERDKYMKHYENSRSTSFRDVA